MRYRSSSTMQRRSERWLVALLMSAVAALALGSLTLPARAGAATPAAVKAAPAKPPAAPAKPAAPPAPPAATTETGSDTIDLAGGWEFKGDWMEDGLSQGWQKPEFDDSSWQTLTAPGAWEEQGVNTPNPRWPSQMEDDGYNGYGWYRRHVLVPADWAGAKVTVRIGAIDDMDWTYVNGKQIGSSTAEKSFEHEREYELPAGSLKAGADNVIVVRVLDTGGSGGIVDGPIELTRERPEAAAGAEQQPQEKDTRKYRESRGDMVQIFGGVKVPESVKVDGDAVAVGGSAEVLGRVTGEVVSVGGSVWLRPGSRVDGNVTAVGGSVHKEGDAEVGGSITQVTIFPWAMPGLGFLAWPFSFGSYSALNDFVQRLITWGILGLILALLLPKRLEVMARALPLYPGWVAAHGVVGAVMTPAVVALMALVAAAVSIVLVLTIIGIALIPAVAVLLVAALLGVVAVVCMGLGGVWLGLGEVITARFNLGSKGVLPAVLIGVVATAAASVVPTFGALIVTTLLVFAYGVALMTGLGMRPDWSHRRMHIHSAPQPEASPEQPG